MKHLTPDEAREHLAWPEGKDHPKVRDGSGQTWFEVQAGESHPYWNRLPDAPYEDAVMYAVARDALATIAGMREEWGVEERHEYTGEWTWHSTHPDRESARSAVNGMDHFRIARRYVTKQEEA